MHEGERSFAERTVAEALTAVGGDGGGRVSASQLLPLVYDLLRERARVLMGRESAGHTLSPTALVHEAYLRVADRRNGFEGRRHFYNAAAEAMRRILVDHARARGATKRCDRRAMRLGLEGLDASRPFTLDSLDWLALDEALEELARRDRRRHQGVMLRFFAGLSEPEVARMLGVDERTVRRDWVTTRLWLYTRLAETAPESS